MLNNAEAYLIEENWVIKNYRHFCLASCMYAYYAAENSPGKSSLKPSVKNRTESCAFSRTRRRGLWNNMVPAKNRKRRTTGSYEPKVFYFCAIIYLRMGTKYKNILIWNRQFCQCLSRIIRISVIRYWHLIGDSVEEIFKLEEMVSCVVLTGRCFIFNTAGMCKFKRQVIVKGLAQEERIADNSSRTPQRSCCDVRGA